MAAPEDGKIKLFLIYQALKARQENSELFQRGDYQKLAVLGSLKDKIVAFSRNCGERTAIVIAPRLLTDLVKEGEYPLGEQVWQETRISVAAGHLWKNAITNQEIQSQDTLWMRDVLGDFPVALLINQITENSEVEEN
jgi:(1->4)-alpha-D-glucan 1-alpha-D-glucosylmutase